MVMGGAVILHRVVMTGAATTATPVHHNRVGLLEHTLAAAASSINTTPRQTLRQPTASNRIGDTSFVVMTDNVRELSAQFAGCPRSKAHIRHLRHGPLRF